MRNKKPGNLWSAILEGVVAGIEEAVDELSANKDQANADDSEQSSDVHANCSTSTVGEKPVWAAQAQDTDQDGASLNPTGANRVSTNREASDEKVGSIKCNIKIGKEGISINNAKLSTVLNHLVDSLVGTVRAKTSEGLQKIESLAARGNAKDSASELDQKESRLQFRFRGKRLVESYIDEAFITIPEGTEIIGARVFENHLAITHVSLPASLKRIDKYAFTGCVNLKSITFPEGLTEIGHYAFWGCESLKSIHLPDSIKKLGVAAFAECHVLEKLVLPRQLRTVPSELCACCWSLEEVRWPDQVDSVGKDAFMQCCTFSSPLDYFELRAHEGLVKVHVDMDAWLVQNNENKANSRLIAWYILDILQFIYGHSVDSASHRDHAELFYTVFHIVGIISNYDAYAQFFALEHLRRVFCEFDVRWHPNDDLEKVLISTLCVIGGTGDDYRRLDNDLRLHIEDICQGDLECVLGDELQHEITDPQMQSIRDIVDNYIENNCNSNPEEIVQIESYDEKTGKYKEPSADDLKQYILWLKVLDDLSVSPGTRRYNPRVYHNVAVKSGYYNYWDFVDVVDGLIRGTGREKRRYSPDDVCEFSSPLDWFAAWSKEIAEGEPVRSNTLTLVVYSYVSESDSSKKLGDGEKKDLFMVLERWQSLALRGILEEYGLSEHVQIWCDGFDMMRLHVV